MLKKNVQREQALDTDVVMTNLWLCLAEDFSYTYGPDPLHRIKARFLKDGVKGFRDEKWPSRPSNLPPHLFKWLYQLENLFKRYRFENDVFTDAELESEALRKFRDTQRRCAEPLNVTPVVFKVLQRARVIVTRILGKYDLGEHYMKSRFGKRACLGTPYRSSYLDEKLMSRPFTGSHAHLQWFQKCIQEDGFLQQCWNSALKEQRVHPVSDLCYTCVPKSYKAFRGMMPDTLLGSFYTAGLGKILEERLRRAGLDIKRLQEKHRVLAKRASKRRHLVTADLSSASDSITLQLLRFLLPSKWYQAITLGRARYVTYNGERILLSSIVTMGLGQTFPLQTLVFYSIISAIGELQGSPFFVSVYGDDLIYSRHLHRYVVEVFPKIHLILNEDKTYVSDCFRESCGGDYYRGVDVRPYQPEGCGQRLIGLRRQNFLHRLYNGLRSRWEEVEIPLTIGYLEAELSLCGPILQVPPQFPDESGVKVDWPCKGLAYSPVYWASPWADNPEKHCGWVFKYLHSVGDDRVVHRFQAPYLWERLRRSALREPLEKSQWDDEADVPVLRWRKSTRRPLYVRSTISGRRWRRLIAVVTKKGSERLQVSTSSTACWMDGLLG